MKNDLAALNNYLFESLERLLDDDLDDQALDKEIKRAKTVASIAVSINTTAQTQLKAIDLAMTYGVDTVQPTGLLPEEVTS